MPRDGGGVVLTGGHHTEKGAFDEREGTLCDVGKNALARENKHISLKPGVCLVAEQQPDEGG